MDNNINYLKILGVNCPGIRDKSKRKDVFNYLHDKKYNIFFLQDTYFVYSPNILTLKEAVDKETQHLHTYLFFTQKF